MWSGCSRAVVMGNKKVMGRWERVVVRVSGIDW